MPSIRYRSTTMGDTASVHLVREILDDSETVISTTEVDNAEVASTAPEVFSQYLSDMASQLQATTDHLNGLSGSPTSTTYHSVGQSLVSLRTFIDRFDRNLLPPDNQ